MPYTNETSRFLDQANVALSGSPYSFPDDEKSRQRIVEIRRSVEHVATLASELRSRIQSPGRSDVGVSRIHRTQEVYESNAIEGVGLPIKRTHALLNSVGDRGDDAAAYVEWALMEGIREDRHTYEVIGLDAARSLAKSLAHDVHRPLTESDVRSLHKIIMGEVDHAGMYKRFHVSIAGSDHVPPAPTDAPAQVAELVAWINGLEGSPDSASSTIIESAATHAWFAHIHPFEDGNGRVARLLSNLVLSRRYLPPLIVRNKSDRGRYIDSLGASDSAGDLTRLVLGFSRYLERTGSDYTDPKLADRIFQADVKERRRSDFSYWEKGFAQWLSQVRAELVRRNLESHTVGGISPGDFEYLRRRSHLGNSWLLKVHNREEQELLVWIGYASNELYRFLEKDEVYPTLFLSVSNTLGDGVPYVWVRRDGRQVFTDFMLEPRSNQVFVYGRGTGRAILSPDRAAEEFASSVSSFLRRPPDLTRESVRGLPRDPDLWRMD